jgi:hypothetical protein
MIIKNRLIIPILLSISIVLLINAFSDNVELYNAILYGLFMIVVTFRLCKNIYSNYLIKNKPNYIGEIISLEKKDPNEVAEIDYIIYVKFVSPHDNKQYTIKSQLNSKPLSNLVQINVNEKTPLKSKVLEMTTTVENVTLFVPAIVFCYLMIKNLLLLDIH